MAIDVHPDLSVVVTASTGSTDEAVEQRVRKRAAWIVQQQRFFETYLPKLPPRRYVSGESHRYLGRQYRLRVHQAEADGVKMARGQINVGLTDTSKKERVRSLVTAWFRRRAEAVFGDMFAECTIRAERHGIQPDGFQIRKMTNRWGSCTAEGHILLNPDLIVAPLPCIEYVVVHELCHLQGPQPRHRLLPPPDGDDAGLGAAAGAAESVRGRVSDGAASGTGNGWRCGAGTAGHQSAPTDAPVGPHAGV